MSIFENSIIHVKRSIIQRNVISNNCWIHVIYLDCKSQCCRNCFYISLICLHIWFTFHASRKLENHVLIFIKLCVVSSILQTFNSCRNMFHSVVLQTKELYQSSWQFILRKCFIKLPILATTNSNASIIY